MKILSPDLMNLDFDRQGFMATPRLEVGGLAVLIRLLEITRLRSLRACSVSLKLCRLLRVALSSISHTNACGCGTSAFCYLLGGKKWTRELSNNAVHKRQTCGCKLTTPV